MIKKLSFAVCCIAILLRPVASLIHDASVATEHHEHGADICEKISGLTQVFTDDGVEHDTSLVINKNIVFPPAPAEQTLAPVPTTFQLDLRLALPNAQFARD